MISSEEKLKFYQEIGMTEEQALKRIAQQKKTEAWVEEVLERGERIPKLAKSGPFFQYIPLIPLGILIFLSSVEEVKTWVQANPIIFFVVIGLIFLSVTIGTILNHFNIQNETYRSVKEHQDWYNKNIKELEVNNEG